MYNVGITDIKGAYKIYPREYSLWEHMLRRCYSKDALEKRPSYIKTKVCDRWLIFSNFLEDLPYIIGYDYWLQNPRCQISLDKDILGDGTMYDLESCVFIPKSFNSKICRDIYGNKHLVKHAKTFNKPIIMLNKDLQPLVIYESLSDCARKTNLSVQSISKVCKGHRKTHKGFIFKYLENYFSIL